MPEGVEVMVEAWCELRADLTRNPHPFWTPAHRERAENLTGRKADHAHGSRINIISRKIWGDTGSQVVEDARQAEALKAKARAEMAAYIDEQIESLEAH